MKLISRLIIIAFIILLPLPALAVDDNAPPFVPPKLTKDERKALREKEAQEAAKRAQNSNSTQTTTNTTTSNTNATTPNTTTPTTETNIDVEQEVKNAKPAYSPRSATARVHMSAVAKAVESLVRLSDRTEDKGIGVKVRAIAKAQKESTDNSNKALDKAENRNKALRVLLGPDYKNLKEVKKEITKNESRIRELERILKDTTNEADKAELQKQITSLNEQNTSLTNELKEKTQGFALLGWLMKWVYRY